MEKSKFNVYKFNIKFVKKLLKLVDSGWKPISTWKSHCQLGKFTVEKIILKSGFQARSDVSNLKSIFYEEKFQEKLFP